MVNFLLTLPSNKIAIIARDVQPTAFIHPASFPCEPDYAALVAAQARLVGNSSPSDQLLSSVGMVIEVGKLATELLDRGVHGTPASCNVTAALLDDLRQVQYIFDQLDMSVTGATERWVLPRLSVAPELMSRQNNNCGLHHPHSFAGKVGFIQ